MVTRDDDVVFNVVWTGNVFRFLRFFVCSLLDRSGARFRFVANGVTPDARQLMDDFARAHGERVVEIYDMPQTEMVAHGVALDAVLESRNDGELFCFVDSDIKARKSFLPEFLALLAEHDAVTSGREVWNDDSVVPRDHPGLDGQYFFDQNGFTYGSPHFAMYRRDQLVATMSRWGISFGSRGPDLSDPAREQLRAMGQLYWVFDTAKVVNILLQGDGGTLCHFDHPELVHIGGLSHYLDPPRRKSMLIRPEGGTTQGDEDEPEWGRLERMASRFEVARFTAAMLRSLTRGEAAPAMPAGLEPAMEHRLEVVRDEMTDLVTAYPSC